LNELESHDLIDFFLPRNNKIFPLNKIKESLEVVRNETLVRNMYKGIGVCIVSQVIKPADLEKLSEYYLVWYKLKHNNKNRKTGHQHNTTNFQFSEYIDEFLHNPNELPSNYAVLEYIKKLRNGWSYPIEIIVAYDTAIKTGLIVDATKHSLALYYIKQTQEEELQMLLQKNEVVNLCQMNSFHCRNIFIHDFARIISNR
jgi:hypothetical protein